MKFSSFLFQGLYASLLVVYINLVVVFRVVWDQLNQHQSKGPPFVNDAEAG